jgi:hypothetical protein
MTATLIAPERMKVTVAAIERDERRPIPQRPCPLVQPLESLVPKPTRTPWL